MTSVREVRLTEFSSTSLNNTSQTKAEHTIQAPLAALSDILTNSFSAIIFLASKFHSLGLVLRIQSGTTTQRTEYDI